MNEAAERALRVEAGLRAVAEWEAEHGTLTDGELAEADRFLADVREFTEQHARTVGRLLRESGSADIVDASVVAMAQRFDKEVLTSDPEHLGPIAATLGPPRVTIRALNDLSHR